jgi:hypothetical protein
VRNVSHEEEVEEIKRAVNSRIEQDAQYRSELRIALKTKNEYRLRELVVNAASWLGYKAGNIAGTIILDSAKFSGVISVWSKSSAWV